MLDDATRYSLKPFVGSSHTLSLNQILKEERDVEILDVGSAKGMMGSLLRENGFLNIDAVEIDEHARKEAKKYYNNMYDSLDKVEKKYDLILLLDVLEHTVFPESFLESIFSKLNEGGKLLLSVPNVANWYVRLSLLFGNFNYQEKGILDRTHLRFFTRKTIKDLVLSFDNVKILSCKVTYVPYELFIPKKIVENKFFQFTQKIRLAYINLFPTLFGYQHFLVIQKDGGES